MTQWIRTHWSTTILLLLATGVIAYQTIATYVNSVVALSPASVQLLTLTLIAVFVMDSAIDRSRVTHAMERLAVRRRYRTLKFEDSLLSQSELLYDSVENQKVEFTNRYDSMGAILRLIDCAQQSYSGINYYVGGWSTDMKDFFAANLAAMRRGVKIERYFVVSREVLSNTTLVSELTEIMESHSSNGVVVFFIHEEDAKSIPYFRERSLRGCGLYDGQIFSFDTAPAQKNGGPVEITITWKQDEVRQHNPFPHLQANNKLYRWPTHRKKIELWTSL